MFSEGKCYFFTILCPNIPCIASKFWLVDAILSVICIQSLADNNLICLNFFTEIFWTKIWLFIKFLHYLQFSAFSMPQSDAYHWKLGTLCAICIAMSFDARSGCEWFFIMYLFRKIVKKRFQPLSTLPRIFYPIAQTMTVNGASWCSLDCLEKQTRAFQVTLVRG